MPFNLLWFHYDEWYSRYGLECSSKTFQEWNQEAYSNMPIGVTYLTMGILAKIIYIPFLLAMLQKDVFKNSCYKIMFLLGLLDMVAIPTDAIIPGIQTILGEHFCARPVFNYVGGVLAMGIYHGVTMTCIILAIDRFTVMLFPNVAKRLFGRKMIYLWLCVPFLYMGFFFACQTPVVFNIKHLSWHFDPYLGIERIEGHPIFYNHPMLVINSFLTVFIMSPVYIILCVILYKKPGNIPSITKLQKIMLLQSFAICFEMFVVATVYVANQWITVPVFMTKIEHIVLICIHCDTPFIYLMLNATLRKKFYEVIKAYMLKSGKTCKHALENATSVCPKIFKSRVHAHNQTF